MHDLVEQVAAAAAAAAVWQYQAEPHELSTTIAVDVMT